jgi:drug/metabolite transporter (DMT)-like permease
MAMWGNYLIVIACVVGIAAGQLLFKACANAYVAADSRLTTAVLGYMTAAMVLYGATSLVWTLLLRHMELGRIYPFMALAFVLVPLASHVVYGENFSPAYFVGIAFIIAGILIVTRVA